MHEGRGGLKEDLDHSPKICHSSQVQAHAAACQPHGMVEQEGGIPGLLIECPGRLIYCVIDDVPVAH